MIGNRLNNKFCGFKVRTIASNLIKYPNHMLPRIEVLHIMLATALRLILRTSDLSSKEISWYSIGCPIKYVHPLAELKQYKFNIKQREFDIKLLIEKNNIATSFHIL